MLKVSGQVIGCAMEVHRTLGNGFLEAVYENSLAIELQENSIKYQKQVPINVVYKGTLVGKYFADMIVENRLLLELKAQNQLTPICEAQLLNYLEASGITIGLLLNFGANSLQIKRMVTTSYTAQDI